MAVPSLVIGIPCYVRPTQMCMQLFVAIDFCNFKVVVVLKAMNVLPNLTHLFRSSSHQQIFRSVYGNQRQ